ncbi:hypothetical protein BGZ61DRAFT_169953 [Ilyonectria robusta]|uniref:uncharacterized protein n=1 Tax=Ilyonectria robusta TaxID=1079257 RepID=UPI001E8DDAD8|nr:uncharacterized protein BGZ61DRAFT_169953 [Ilyonectria robusta]KAH8734064.1 hypothetical protein BGZ61DRAFT_169953 [Ilyonectria robusta]
MHVDHLQGTYSTPPKLRYCAPTFHPPFHLEIYFSSSSTTTTTTSTGTSATKQPLKQQKFSHRLSKTKLPSSFFDTELLPAPSLTRLALVPPGTASSQPPRQKKIKPAARAHRHCFLRPHATVSTSPPNRAVLNPT